MSAAASGQGRLAIAIPTYNRAQILKDNLESMLPELRQFAVSLYISDDSDNADTERVCDELRIHYPNIQYRRNRPSLGHDQNMLATLSWPTQAHVWLLGDSMFVQQGGIEDVVSAIADGPDFAFLSARPNLRLPTSLQANLEPATFFRQFAWHLTQTGATVYGRRPLEHIRSVGALHAYRNFMQLGLVLQYAQSQTSRIACVQRELLRHEQSRTSYWTRDAVKVFAGDWCALIDETAALWGSAKSEVDKSHARHTGVLSFRHLLTLRKAGALSRVLVTQFQDQISRGSTVPLSLIKLICHIPTGLLARLPSRSKRSGR